MSRAPQDHASPGTLRGAELRRLVERVLDEGKAGDVTCIDLAGKSTIADCMVIASGRSARHVTSLAENLALALKRAGAPRLSVEGERRGDWILLDAGDVIVHIFRPETRLFYDLEKMWNAPLPEAV